MRKAALLGSLLFASMAARLALAQPTVAIQSDAQPREVYIGDRILLKVVVTVSSGIAQSPVVLPQPLGSFETLVASTPTFMTDPSGKSAIASEFVLTTFSTGSQIVPAITIRFSTPDGVVSEGKTEPITIKVKSLLQEKGDEGNLRPLKGLFNFKSYFWLWFLLTLIALAAGGTFLWRWLSGRGEADGAVSAGPPRPPEELAWEAIHALEDDDLITHGQTKEFYFRLSIILREYLERRYGMSALDRTTSELLADFRAKSFPHELSSLMRAFFDSADLVKFAKFTPMEQEVTNDLNQVKQFINITTPQKTEVKEEKIPL